MWSLELRKPPWACSWIALMHIMAIWTFSFTSDVGGKESAILAPSLFDQPWLGVHALAY